MVQKRWLIVGLFVLGIAWLGSGVGAQPNGTLLYPFFLRSVVGTASDQPLAVLAVADQSGSDDNWNRYKEFYTGANGYVGVFVFGLSAGISPADLTSVQLQTNYKGASYAEQQWVWQLRDFQNQLWVSLGNNNNAGSWLWTSFAFNANGDLSRFVNGNNQLWVRYLSLSSADNSDLDYLALMITADNITPTPTPIPTITPTPPPGGEHWQPTPGTSWQIQYSGSIDTSVDVDMYDIDLFDSPQSLIDQLQGDGKKVVCYFSAGSYEDWRPDADQFPEAVLGLPLDGWPGERWLDIRQIDLLAPIMTARMDLAVQKGCDGVDPDNIDGYSNNTGFPLSFQEQLTYNIWLANQAHGRGLAIGLKNDLDQIQQLVGYFDWVVNEQCFQYNECGLLLPFIQANKPVFGIEYAGNPLTFCPQANGLNFDTLKKHLELDAWRISCR